MVFGVLLGNIGCSRLKPRPKKASPEQLLLKGLHRTGRPVHAYSNKRWKGTTANMRITLPTSSLFPPPNTSTSEGTHYLCTHVVILPSFPAWEWSLPEPRTLVFKSEHLCRCLHETAFSDSPKHVQCEVFLQYATGTIYLVDSLKGDE